MRLQDLPPAMQEQARRQLEQYGSPKEYNLTTAVDVRGTVVSVDARPIERKTATTHEKPPTKPHERAERPAGKLMPYHFKTRHKPVVRPPSGMTQTEAAYQREILLGKGRFEPMSFRLAGGSRYTPDFMTIDDGIVTLHEVKGSYRLESEGRAWTAFNEAAAQFPMFRWIWAVRGKHKADGWSIKRRFDIQPNNVGDCE